MKGAGKMSKGMGRALRFGKIVPNRVQALLDMGAKPIYELMAESGRAINTTGNHPYLVRIKSIAAVRETIDFGSRDIQDLPNKASHTSFVDSTFTLDCLLNAFSSDQTGQSNASAREKYGISLECGANDLASDANILNCSKDMKSISDFRNLNTAATSSGSSLDLSTISSKFLPSSKNKYSGAANSNLLRNLFTKKITGISPLESRPEITLLESTTISNGYHFNGFKNLSARALSTLSESSLTSASVNLLLDTTDLISSSTANSLLTSLLTARDQSVPETSMSSSFSSSGIDITTSAMCTTNLDGHEDLNSLDPGVWLKVIYLVPGMEIAVAGGSSMEYLPLLMPFAAYSDEKLLDSRNSLTSILTFSSSRNFGEFDIMLSTYEPGSIYQGLSDHLLGQTWIAPQYPFNRLGSGNQFNNITDQYSSASEGGLAVADFAISDDVAANVNSHNSIDKEGIFKDSGGLCDGRGYKSVLRNKLIAQVFFDIGFIERWGTGTHRIIQACLEQGLPEPKFEEYQGFRVIFRKFHIPDEAEKKLNERQRTLIETIKKKGEIVFGEYRQLFPKIAERTLRNDLEEMVSLKVLTARGKKRGRKYHLSAISAEYRQR